MIRRLQQCARQHSEKFGRRIYRQVERLTRDGLFALFAAILPAGPTVLQFEMLFDWRLHVIIAVAVVCGRHTGVIEFPSSSDVIAATTIGIGIIRVHCAVGLKLYGLGASGVTLNENFVGVMLR